MATEKTLEELLPLIAGLSQQDRVRLIQIVTQQLYADAGAVYEAFPPGRDEFSSDEEPLAWEGEGWEDVE